MVFRMNAVLAMSLLCGANVESVDAKAALWKSLSEGSSWAGTITVDGQTTKVDRLTITSKVFCPSCPMKTILLEFSPARDVGRFRGGRPGQGHDGNE